MPSKKTKYIFRDTQSNEPFTFSTQTSEDSTQTSKDSTQTSEGLTPPPCDKRVFIEIKGSAFRAHPNHTEEVQRLIDKVRAKKDNSTCDTPSTRS